MTVNNTEIRKMFIIYIVKIKIDFIRVENEVFLGREFRCHGPVY